MHHILPSNLNSALDEISTARLSNYKTFFSPINEEELYGLYCWNDAISSRYMRLIGILEIILRNRFHTALSNYAWDSVVSHGTINSNDWYMQLYQPFTGGQTQSDRSLKKKIGSTANPATPNKVIAGLTYGFWPHLLDRTVNTAGNPVPWGTLIPIVVPGHHQRASTYWAISSHQDGLYARIQFVGDLRNRVAHFEPLWKFGDELSETRDRPNNPRTIVSAAPLNIPQCLQRLQKSYQKTTQLLHWLSKSRAKDYSESENHQSLRWLMTEDGLKHFRNLGAHQQYRLGSLTKAWGLKLKLQEHPFALVTHKQKPVGRYYSDPS